MDNRSFESGAAASPPSAPASPSAGYPSNGNPGGGVQATVPGDYWFHQLGEELRAVITAAGLTPDAGNLAQLLAALNAGWGMVKSLTDPGYIRLPGGLIIQWGTASTSGGGTVNVTFPLAFPTGILVCYAADRSADVAASHIVASSDGTSTGMTIYAQTFAGNAVATGIKWLAIGY